MYTHAVINYIHALAHYKIVRIKNEEWKMKYYPAIIIFTLLIVLSIKIIIII